VRKLAGKRKQHKLKRGYIAGAGEKSHNQISNQKSECLFPQNELAFKALKH
jgi:hypothetical protein